MLLQFQKSELRPQTTAHLAQTMELLLLPGLELRQKIETELASNPALELLDHARCLGCKKILPKSGMCPSCSSAHSMATNDPIVFVSPRRDFINHNASPYREELQDDDWAAAKEDLPTYILRQIAPDLEMSDRKLAVHILTSLDEDGLMTSSIIEIAQYHHTTLAHVERIQRIIQRVEPVGVGSSSPKQALLAQLEVLAETRAVPQMASEAIQEGLDLLSRRAYNELARLLKISINEVKEIASFISDNLNPFPGRAHWGDRQSQSENPPVYQDPDVIISRLRETADTPLVVEIVSPYAGSLGINPLFRQALHQAPEHKTTQWHSDLDRAVLLVKCIQQRDNTLVRLMQKLVRLQRDYILFGDSRLVPLTRAWLADELELHESTISRAVAGKAVQLPNNKIVPLAKWFDRSLHIRSALLQIIEHEQEPLSDTQIADLLLDQGFSVARRTVAKYRSMEGILPSRLRHTHATMSAQ